MTVTPRKLERKANDKDAGVPYISFGIHWPYLMGKPTSYSNRQQFFIQFP